MLPYMAQTCPQNILSRSLWCHKIPHARNDLNRSRGAEPRQLIGLASDNAHFDPTLLLLVKITVVIFRVSRESLGSNVNKYGGFWKYTVFA
jgi:hypothetical protein